MFELIKFLTIERLKDKMLQCENLDQDVKEAFKGQLDRLRARYQEHKFIKEFLDISYGVDKLDKTVCLYGVDEIKKDKVFLDKTDGLIEYIGNKVQIVKDDCCGEIMLVAYFISYGQPITKARAYIKTDLDLDSITDDELIELVKKEIPKQGDGN